MSGEARERAVDAAEKALREAGTVMFQSHGDRSRAIRRHLAETMVAAVWPVAAEENERLRAEIVALHFPFKEEAEFWYDPGAGNQHDERFADCPAIATGDDRLCEGHTATIRVCSECGYDHDDGAPIFRAWPCPTERLAGAALDTGDEQ